MKASHSVFVAIGLATLFHISSVSGQVLRSVALDGGVGIADGRGGEFADRGFAAAHIDASGVLPITQNIGAFVTLGYDWFGLVSGHGDNCLLRPGVGGCAPSFPTGGGASLTLGGALALGRAIELRAGAGAGVFALDNIRVGGLVAEGEAAVFPVASLGIVARTRTVAIPSFRGDRLSVAHWLLGIRLR